MAEREKNILIVDSGSRGHAIADKLRESSPEVGNIYLAPGNAGTDFVGGAENLALDINKHSEVIEAAKDLKVDLVIIAPEEPLVKGLVNVLESEYIDAFGPTKEAARIEGDKIWAMELTEKNGVPIPKYAEFDNPNAAHKFVVDPPDWALRGIAIKAYGLAGGKGVFMAFRAREAHEVIENIMVKKIFGEAGEKILIQERLEGYEMSVMAIVYGEHIIILPTSEDHKQENNHDKGRNTGGMGSVAPHPLITQKDLDVIEFSVIKPLLRGIRNEAGYFRGVLYPALFMTKDGPKVIEVNCRPGGSEWEALSQLFDFNLYKALKGIRTRIAYKPGSAVSVALTSNGYPGPYENGKNIEGLDKCYEGVTIYHAGTKCDGNGNYQTSGGRVLFVTAHGESVDDARQKAYSAIGANGVHFEGMHYRTDIGNRKR